MVQGYFLITYGPKTLKYPWLISLKTLGHFKLQFKNTIGNPFFDFLIIGETIQKEI